MVKLLFYLLVFINLFVLGCSESKDTQSQLRVKKQITKKPISLRPGIEAVIKKSAALWSDSELKVLNGPNWANAKASKKLDVQTKVFVLDLGDEYAKIKTSTCIQGWIVKDLLKPLANATDSTKYFGSKQFGYINTFVDGMDVRIVNLWKDKQSRRTIIDKCFKGDKVVILSKDNEYVKLRTINGKEGWCMKEFVKFQ